MAHEHMFSLSHTVGVWSNKNKICVMSSTYFGGGENQIKIHILKLENVKRITKISKLWSLTSENIDTDHSPFWSVDGRYICIVYFSGIRIFDAELGTICSFLENTVYYQSTWFNVLPLWSNMKKTLLIENITTETESYNILRMPFSSKKETINTENGVYLLNPRGDGIMTLTVNENTDRVYFEFIEKAKYLKDTHWYNSMTLGWELDGLQNPDHDDKIPCDCIFSSVSSSGDHIAFTVYRKTIPDIYGKDTAIFTCIVIDIETPKILWQRTENITGYDWSLPVIWDKDVVTFFADSTKILIWSKTNGGVVLANSGALPEKIQILTEVYDSEHNPYLLGTYRINESMVYLLSHVNNNDKLNGLKDYIPRSIFLKIELYCKKWQIVGSIALINNRLGF